MPRALFPSRTEETAPAAAQRTLQAVAKQTGYLPEAVARMAESPETLKGFLTANGVFEQATLTALERETIVFAVATRNGCEVCVALHTARLLDLSAPTELIAAMRDRKPLPDTRLAALWAFTDAVMDRAGAVTDDELAALLAAGFTARNALEVVLGVGTYTISTFANRLTGAPLDPPLAAVWPVPAASGTPASSAAAS